MIRALLIVICTLASLARAQELPSEIFDRDKPYGGHPRHLIDVAARPLSALKPALLIVHGGSWQSGDKRMAVSKNRYFLQEGFAVAAMNYRLHPEVTPREQAEDVAAAAVWLAANADRYGIDPRQIYLAGHGAGAHLVSLVGTDPYYLAEHGASPGDLGGVVALDAEAYDLPAEIAATTIETEEGRTLRQVFTSNAAFWPIVSPAYQTNKAEVLPPFFLIYAAGSTNAYRQAKPFGEQLRRSGGVAVLHEALGRDRESVFRYFGTENDATTDAALAFIRREANIIVSSQQQSAEMPAIPWHFALEAGEEDINGRRITGNGIDSLVTHEDRLFAGNTHGDPNDELRGQVLRLDAREERWQVEYQMPRGYARVASMAPATFATDAEGRPMQALSYLFAGASRLPLLGRPGEASVFIRTPSGNWTKSLIGAAAEDDQEVQVGAMTAWRDRVTGADLVLAGASPAPLGITRGSYAPDAVGGIAFDPEPEFTPRPGEHVRSFAACGGRLFAATDRQILRRTDGPEADWQVLLDFEEQVTTRPFLDELDPRWHRRYRISSFRCDLSQSKPALAFTTLNRAFRFTPGEEAPVVETNLADLVRTQLGREPDYVHAMEALTLRRRGRDVEEWIGLEISYDLNYLAARPTFPYSMNGHGRDAWYLVRSVIGGQTHYRLEEIFIPGNNANRRPLARISDFERSPFERDNAIYVGGVVPAPEGTSNAAWIARGEL